MDRVPETSKLFFLVLKNKKLSLVYKLQFTLQQDPNFVEKLVTFCNRRIKRWIYLVRVQKSEIIKTTIYLDNTQFRYYIQNMRPKHEIMPVVEDYIFLGT